MKHPMQPVGYDDHKVIRFQSNHIVRHLLDFATAKGCGLNELGCMGFSRDDWMQLAQLIGYSVSGYGSLSYVGPKACEKADAAAAVAIKRRYKLRLKPRGTP